MKLLLILFAGVLLARAAHADEAVPINQIRPLIEWVETRTNTMLLPRPKIYISSEAWLRMTANAHAAHSGAERIAAYRDGTIFISEKFWQPGNRADDSVLVHELVHYAQDLGDRKYGCAGQREAEAYRMQNAYLYEHGERAYMEREALDQMSVCE